jgi:hypothetical protein
VTRSKRLAIYNIVVGSTYVAIPLGVAVFLLASVYTSIFSAPPLLSQIPLGVLAYGVFGLVISMAVPPPRANDE